MKYYIEKQVMKCFTKKVEVPFKQFRNTATWRTASGNQIKIENLDDNHLRNLIAQFENSYCKSRVYNGITISSWLAIFKEERKYRKSYKAYLSYIDTYLQC